jgi:hypothetical protein
MNKQKYKITFLGQNLCHSLCISFPNTGGISICRNTLEAFPPAGRIPYLEAGLGIQLGDCKPTQWYNNLLIPVKFDLKRAFRETKEIIYLLI